MRIEQWSKIAMYDPSSFIVLPEGRHSEHLSGAVYGHPKHEDGKRVTTSAIVGKNGERVVTESGSEYELGEIDPQYAQMFPNAKRRLLRTLPETTAALKGGAA